jgi:hypothetical protein
MKLLTLKLYAGTYSLYFFPASMLGCVASIHHDMHHSLLQSTYGLASIIEALTQENVNCCDTAFQRYNSADIPLMLPVSCLGLSPNERRAATATQVGWGLWCSVRVTKP